MPFKLHSKGRRHIPRQRHRVTNWREYDVCLRNRGSLTIWFTPDAIAGWKAQPRTTPGGQRHYSNLAIETALTLRTVFRLALRQSEGLIGSIMRMLEIDLPVPDHTTLSRRACGLPVQLPWRNKTSDLHLIVDSTGLKLRGAGEWLFEKHGTAKRRAWRKLHIGIDADSGEIVAFDLSDKDVDDASHVPTLLDQLTQAPASFMADGAYDRTATYDAILARNSFARFIVPPCKGAVPGPTATISPTQRDLHILAMDEQGRMNWQKASGYNKRSKVEAAIGRYKRVIGDALNSRHDARRATEVAIAVKSLNRMREFGQAKFVRVAGGISPQRADAPLQASMQQAHTERLAEAGVEPSVGSVGDSYDNALAETINGLYKAEVIHRRGPWRSFEAVEFATLAWVDWFNNRRLLEPIGNIPPAEAEERYYAMTEQPAMAA